MEYYARVKSAGINSLAYQPLVDHLQNVARLSSTFAELFGAPEWGFLAGLWHDLGKYQPKFQERLAGKAAFVEHSGVGAKLSIQKNSDEGYVLGFIIAGHHAGLANPVENAAGLPKSLTVRMQENEQATTVVKANIPQSIIDRELPEWPLFLNAGETASSVEKAVLRRSCEFWIRFLFSALVDADRLDSEAFESSETASARSRFSSIAEMRARLDSYIDDKVAALPEEVKGSLVNIARSDVLTACRLAAEQPPGAFSLTVPTGGGKTLSSMSLALRNAECHNLRRVIVVIPYTSIIEQNAGEYRKALGADNVVEHHSNLDPQRQRDELGEETAERHDLACDNWDAPVIVTTTVQFFESLFSNRPSQCRKLHNIARSVIILDEVQTLPPGFLLSIIDGLNELVAHYGCSIVLSTATQPALSERPRFPGLKNVREVISEPEKLVKSLQRVCYSWPDENAPALDWPELASELSKHPQVLAVVHRRADARTLAELVQTAIPKEYIFHLSALMCPAHRSNVLAQIKDRLSSGDDCRVISTQLVEAGVDIDFPVVYRALGGLDSMVQAGGRCNREGRLSTGNVVVFRAPTPPPRGTPTRAMRIMESLIKENGGTLATEDPTLFENYFRMLYHTEELDAHAIQTNRQQLNFATVGRDFKLIEDGFTKSLIVPYDDANERLDILRQQGPSRELFRSLQPFTISIYEDAFQKLERTGALEEVEGMFTLSVGFEHLYTTQFGLVMGDEPQRDPAALIR